MRHDAVFRGGVPPFVENSMRLSDAYRFARAAHEGPRRRGTTTIGHPAAVARLLHEAGYPENVVAAALLHDVVEDTATEVTELADRFGDDVAFLVAQLTEDPGIPGYDERKGELRRRVSADGQQTAAIFAADKLASARHLNEHGATVPQERLEHFERTERTIRSRHPDVPFLDALAEEIALLRERAGRA